MKKLCNLADVLLLLRKQVKSNYQSQWYGGYMETVYRVINFYGVFGENLYGDVWKLRLSMCSS